LTAEQVVADLNACNDKIENITGVRPTLVRLPYGDYDDNSINAVRSIGMEPIQWDVDSLDWKDLAAPEITKRVTGKVQAGSIVLFHNAAKHTPEALPGIIECLLQEGYTFVPISQIILDGKYTIDHTGRQCPA
jgi:peptidoglycan/xylan/chitin deacetylase (PgdA/CDA1 family)